MRAQIGVQKSTGKIRGNWGRQKGVFFEGSAEEGKFGQFGFCRCINRLIKTWQEIVCLLF